MKYLGIDYGDRRIGVAVSDPAGKIAFPRKTIANRGFQKTFAELMRIIEEENVSGIIIGLPLSLDGRETSQTCQVREFAENFKRISALPLEFENEILTTHLVKKAGVPYEHSDESAAAVILQSYLDKLKA